MKAREPTIRSKVVFLKRPSSYGQGVRGVRAIETHFAWVFLAGRQAYKLKKPLRHRQLDYRTLAARQKGCFEELRLNRRLARTVYESVVPLTFADGRLALGGEGEIVDWLIKMKRLPDAQLLDHALRRGTIGVEQIDRIAETLGRFYSRADAHPVSGHLYLQRISREIRANVREISRYADRLTQRSAEDAGRAQLRAVEALRSTLASRGAHVVECHGDLRAEHVHVGRRISVIDALEFDARLRLLDPAEEVSLLALEIERLGYPQLAERLVERSRQHSVVAPCPEVFCFYKSHRAATRAKLAAWHIGDPQFRDAGPWIARTESLLADALRYAQAACGSDTSTADRRPAVQQGSEGRAGDHPTHCFGEEWGHMQFR